MEVTCGISRTRALYDRGENLSTRVRRLKNLLFSVAQKFNTFNTFNTFKLFKPFELITAFVPSLRAQQLALAPFVVMITTCKHVTPNHALGQNRSCYRDSDDLFGPFWVYLTVGE